MSVVAYFKDSSNGQDWAPFDPAQNGAREISNDFEAQSRINFTSGNLVGGEYVQQPASAIIKWSLTEHAFVLEGSVTITDISTGNKTTFGVGDGWIIEKGSETHWDVTEPFRKAFLLHVE